MQKSLIALAALFALTSTVLLTPKSLASETPTPVTSIATTSIAVATSTSVSISAAPATETHHPDIDTTSADPATPTRLTIPSINLNDAIIPVGLTDAGAMAVPSGSTSNVGWYEDGVIPGDAGSAVLDAHVFAAFSKLNQVKAGDSIYVTDAQGDTLRFVVNKVETYALADITSQMLFAPTNDRDLNLITCAGKLTPDHSTYDHRLVIYTTLAQ
jgi:sortase A